MNKIIITILLFLIVPFVFVTANGELETDYPSVPGSENLGTVDVSISQYIKYIFNFSIWVIGIIAFVLLVKAGVTFLTSTGKPEKIKEAKDQIFAILLGLAILFGSTFILKTIDPSLVLFDMEKLEEIESVPPPSPIKKVSEDPLVRIKELSKTIKDSIAPTLRDENEKLNPLVKRCNCAYSSSKCDCKGWTCSPVSGGGGSCCNKLVNDIVPGLSTSALGQALNALSPSTLNEIASMVSGITSGDLLSDLSQLGQDKIEEIKEALTNSNNLGEIALAILGVENALNELSGENLCNCASNILNLPELDLDNIFSGMSGDKIKEFFLNLAQIPNPEELISSFSKDNLKEIASTISGMSSGDLEKVFSNFSPETIKDIAFNFLGEENINNITSSLNEETIKNIVTNFSNLPIQNIKNDISKLSKGDLANIISEIPENNLEEIAEKLSDLSFEDLQDPFSLTKEKLESAMTEAFSLPDYKNIIEGLPMEEIKKITSSISEENMEDILSFLPSSDIKNIAKEFINFNPEGIKSFLPTDVLENITKGIFNLSPDLLKETLSSLSQEKIIEILKNFSNISPSIIQDIISSLPESAIKDFLSSISDEDIKEIIGEEKIPLENLKEFSSSCYGDPCFNREEIMEEQTKIILAADELLYYKNRINSEREDLETEIEYFINNKILTRKQTDQIEKHLEEIIEPMEEMAEISKELSSLPDECLAPEKCQGNCGGGCHDGCEGTKACYPKSCSGGNPCPTSEIEKKVKETEEKLKEIRKICDKIIAILE
jgi:Mg/Co/Ni transporter MgtE